MSQPRHLFVVAEDGRDHPAALARAGALSHAAGAQLHLGVFGYSRAIAAVGLLSADAMASAREGYVERLRQSAAQRAAGLVTQSPGVSWSASWAHPMLPEVLLQISEQQADMVVTAIHRDPMALRWASTGLVEQLLRHCPVPLMLVGERDRPLPRRMMVAIDVADGDDALNVRLLRNAAGLALLCNAELQVIYVSEPLQLMDNEMLLTGASNRDIEAEVHQLRAEAFGRFADREQIPSERRTFLQGTPALGVCAEAATQDADLIIVGGTRHSGVARWLLGSTTEQIVQNAHCSVLSWAD